MRPSSGDVSVEVLAQRVFQILLKVSIEAQATVPLPAKLRSRGFSQRSASSLALRACTDARAVRAATIQ